MTVLTIGKVAQAAGVGIETVRFYERRQLISQPIKTLDAYRRYTEKHVDRIRFIKRAQGLGFSLVEVASLLELADGTDRRKIRRVASARLAETRQRIADLQAVEHALAHLLRECEAHTRAPRCPIITAIAGNESAKTRGA